MDKSALHHLNPTVEEHTATRTTGQAVTELLEDAGNCRQSINRELRLHLLSDSVFSEQQKLRYVLDWAEGFLHSSSDICRTDRLTLTDTKQRGPEKTSPECTHLSTDKYRQVVSCAAVEGLNGEGNNNACRYKRTLSLSEKKDSGNIKGLDEHNTTSKQIQSQDNSGKSRLHICSQKHHIDTSNSSTNQKFTTGTTTSLIKASASTPSSHKTSSVFGPVRTLQPHGSTGFLNMTRNESRAGNQEDVTAEESEEQHSKKELESSSETIKPPSSTAHLPLPSDLTVYEQYQLCVQHVASGCFNLSSEKQGKTPGDICPITNTETDRYPNIGDKKVTDAETTEERRSLVIRKKQDRSNTPNLDLSKEPVNTPTDPLKPCDIPTAEEGATNPDSLQNKVRCCLARKGHQKVIRGQKKIAVIQNLSSVGTLQRGQNNYTKNMNSKTHWKKHITSYRDTHTSLQPAKGDTLCLDNPRQTSAAEGTTVQIKVKINKGLKFNPADVPVCDWLCLPDEVWLSILSLMPHRDLCRVLQVCHRLHSLATDHTLWANIRIENSTLSDRWLLCVGRRRPRSLCLYSCSSWSVSSSGLEMFLFLCRNSLEELKVTSCTGPGLHGDQMLPLISQLCNRVTGVDVSWSGATDTGVKSLNDCGTRLKLKSVVLNGCHISDVLLKELVVKHKESLCRLEVFGCQFLTSSCLQKIYKMCPRLQHLNIGRVPKVNIRCLMVMTSQLKCLISLNLTGLQVLDDSSVQTLLQNCVKLQNVTFSSCPGVTDLMLYYISKYIPQIRSLDVSRCKAVTDAGVQSLALGCQRLQHLDLSSTGTGNRGVSLVANYCSEHLQTVKLSFCHITAEKILKLCRHCKRLKVLHVYGCARLPTEAEIRHVNSTVNVYPLT